MTLGKGIISLRHDTQDGGFHELRIWTWIWVWIHDTPLFWCDDTQLFLYFLFSFIIPNSFTHLWSTSWHMSLIFAGKRNMHEVASSFGNDGDRFGIGWMWSLCCLCERQRDKSKREEQWGKPKFGLLRACGMEGWDIIGFLFGWRREQWRRLGKGSLGRARAEAPRGLMCFGPYPRYTGRSR